MTNIYLTNLEDLNSFKKLETIFKKAFDEKDTSSKDLALQMISDIIRELEDKIDQMKTFETIYRKQRNISTKNDKEWLQKSDLEWIQEFHKFLQGNIPEKINCDPLNLSPEQSNSVIWYLQEYFPVFPNTIEMCDNCKRIFDNSKEGCYSTIENRPLCGACEHLSKATCCDCCLTD